MSFHFLSFPPFHGKVVEKHKRKISTHENFCVYNFSCVFLIFLALFTIANRKLLNNNNFLRKLKNVLILR